MIYLWTCECGASPSFLTRVKQMKDHKVAQFNFKFFHLILPTNKNLCKWKIQSTDHCIDCNIVQDEIHMLFLCKKIYKIWDTIKRCNFLKSALRNLRVQLSCIASLGRDPNFYCWKDLFILSVLISVLVNMGGLPVKFPFLIMVSDSPFCPSFL